jgi:hypothetical protein
MSAIRLTEATPEQRAAVTCEVCGRPIQTRGWIYPDRAKMIAKRTGSYVHGKCLWRS